MIAMGHPWHPECFRCTVCVKPLTPETFKEYQGKPYCEKDFHNLFSPKCAGCKQPIKDVNIQYIYWKWLHCPSFCHLFFSFQCFACFDLHVNF